jgi:hypothetical protein
MFSGIIEVSFILFLNMVKEDFEKKKMFAQKIKLSDDRRNLDVERETLVEILETEQIGS